MWSCNCSFIYPPGVTPHNTVFHGNGSWTSNSTKQFFPGPPTAVTKEQHCIGHNGTGGLFGVDGTFPDSVVQCYWDNRPYNFDTTPNAMMALFTASTLAGWTDIMEISLDINGIGMQPEKMSKSNSLGLELVEALISQIDGTRTIVSKKGLKHTITFASNPITRISEKNIHRNKKGVLNEKSLAPNFKAKE